MKIQTFPHSHRNLHTYHQKPLTRHSIPNRDDPAAALVALEKQNSTQFFRTRVFPRRNVVVTRAKGVEEKEKKMETCQRETILEPRAWVLVDEHGPVGMADARG
jgi:hypothetical protein